MHYQKGFQENIEIKVHVKYIYTIIIHKESIRYKKSTHKVHVD